MQTIQEEEGLADYFPFLFPDGQGVALVLSAYFDESARDAGDEPICVGGYLFKAGGYKKFRCYWQSHVLKRRGRRMEPFHMTDLVAGKGVYKGVDLPDRMAVLDHAVHAITEFTYGGVGVHFNQAEFERKAPPDWPRRFGSIYTVACHMLLEATVMWLGKWGCQLRVLYVFEQGHKFESEADEFLCAVRGHAEARERFRYRNHIFELKSEYGLQAADFFAWTITRSIVMDPSAEMPRSLQPFAESFVKVANAKHPERYMVHPFTGTMLDSFIADQMTGMPFMTVQHGPRKPAFR